MTGDDGEDEEGAVEDTVPTGTAQQQDCGWRAEYVEAGQEYTVSQAVHHLVLLKPRIVFIDVGESDIRPEGPESSVGDGWKQNSAA